jgi:hypothetical protein
MQSEGEDLLPTGEAVLQSLELFDRGLKSEVILDSVHMVLFFGSFLEIILLSCTFLFLIRKPKTLFYWAMHFPHIVRAFFGLLVESKLPHSEQIIELIKHKEDEEETRSQNLATFEADFNAKIY